MRLVDKDLAEKWNDGSINKRAKGEAMLKFHAALGYAESSNVFTKIIGGRIEPTPKQLATIREVVEEYWNFYNPQNTPAE